MNAETYMTSAGEHVTVARELYDRQRFVLSHYVAGLAVECLFRAYRARIDPEFDSRHDLVKLHKVAMFSNVVPAREQEKISVALGIVVAQWSNDHRFRSARSFRKWLTDRKMYESIKGDFVKELTRRIVEAATIIVSTGAAKWKISTLS